jgi:H+/Cl- antiporter ClcA
VKRQAADPDALAYLRLVGLGAVIGIPAALLAAVFLAFVHDLEHWLWDDLPDALGASSPPWYLVIGLPAVGACVVLAARRLLPGDGGHPPLEGIGGGPVPVVNAPGIALAAIGTLSFGAVLGPEAPLIALGSVVGMAVTLFAPRVDDKGKAVLGTAGSFSAISALFGGPIVGGMMMVEGGLAMGTALLPVLLPGFVAAAVGYVLFVGLGDWGGLSAQGLTVPNLPPYTGTHVYDLIIAVVVGVVAAVIVAAVRRTAADLTREGTRRLGLPVLLVGGGLAVGLVAQIADWLGADSQDVLFSGQAGVPDEATASARILLILLVGKAIGYGISLGCGFRGGPVFPALFLGIAVAEFAHTWFDVSPTLAVAVGAAAGMAAGTRLLITSVLFAGLLVGHAGLDAIPAAVLAAAAAWLTMQALDRRAAAAAPATATA